MPSQRPFFLSSFIAAFRPQQPSTVISTQTQANKHATTAAKAAGTSATASQARNIPRTAAAAAAAAQQQSDPYGSSGGAGGAGAAGRRRGSDSSSEGFRDVLGADKWYIGGRTAGGEEKFFKMGVVRRVRSNDGLSLDRLSL